ncbi:MAG: histidinol-phosphate/aromatic aminotransferase/cobyric acid decarboxylase-like protein, partial [Myxococcota bacterium]
MLPLVNPSFQALARYTTAKPAPGSVRPVARLASNENPCGPSALVAQALSDPS